MAGDTKDIKIKQYSSIDRSGCEAHLSKCPSLSSSHYLKEHFFKHLEIPIFEEKREKKKEQRKHQKQVN